MSERMEIPAVYVVDGCVIVLQEIAAVICARGVGGAAVTCVVILKSGTSFNVDMQHSRSLIQAVEWSRSPGSVIRPRDGVLLDHGERVDNSWGN